MASLAGISGLALPKLNNIDPADATAIRNYLYQLQEQLNYVLTNIDETNFSPDMQATMTASREASRAGRK